MKLFTNLWQNFKGFLNKPLNKSNNFREKLHKQQKSMVHGFQINYYGSCFDTLDIYEECSVNPIAMRCIKIMGESISTIPMEYLLPFSTHSMGGILEVIVMNILIYGNCFLEITKNIHDDYILSILETNKVRLFHRNGTLEDIKYEDGQKLIDKDINNIIHIKNYNPFNLLYGFSITKSVLCHIKQYNYLCNYMINIARHGGMLSGVLSCANNMSAAAKESLQNQIDILYKKMSSTGTIMVLEGGDYNWKNIGLSPKELEITNNMHESACSICRAYGIPLAMLGLNPTEYSTKNYKEIHDSFWQNTIKPLTNKIVEQLCGQIQEKMGSHFFIKPLWHQVMH